MSENKKIVYVLLFGLVFFKFSISYLIITSFPKFIETFGLSNFQLGSIISAYYLSSIIFMFFWLYLFGKYSRIKIFMISSLIWILGSMVFGFSQNYVHLLLLAILVGCGIEASNVFIILILLQMTRNESQGKLFSFFIIIQGLGSLFGIFMASYFQDVLNLEWSFVFIFSGGISLIWFVITGLLLLKSKNINFVMSPYLDQLGYNLNYSELKKVFKKRSNRYLIFMWLYSVPIVTFLNIWTQQYFQGYHSLSQMEASLSFIFLSGGEFLGMVLGGVLFDKFYSTENYRKMYIALIGASIAIPLFIIGLILSWRKGITNTNEDLITLAKSLFFFAINDQTVFLSYFLLFLAFFSISMMYPLFMIIINDCNDDSSKNLMIGIRNIVKIIGLVISPLIGGLIIDSFSILTVMLIVPFFMVIPITHTLLMKNAIEEDFLLKLESEKEMVRN